MELKAVASPACGASPTIRVSRRDTVETSPTMAGCFPIVLPMRDLYIAVSPVEIMLKKSLPGKAFKQSNRVLDR